LTSAEKLLPYQLMVGEAGGTRERFQEWLDHNELELALDDLADIGLANRAAACFWRELSAAAKNMGLDQKCAEYDRYIDESEQ
jgi:hypothetical protein